MEKEKTKKSAQKLEKAKTKTSAQNSTTSTKSVKTTPAKTQVQKEMKNSKTTTSKSATKTTKTTTSAKSSANLTKNSTASKKSQSANAKTSATQTAVKGPKIVKKSTEKDLIKTAIKKISEEKNVENLTLLDIDGTPIEFEQAAVVMLKYRPELFAILFPVTPMQNVEEGQGVVFAVDTINEKITIVNDNDLIDEVLAVLEMNDE